MRYGVLWGVFCEFKLWILSCFSRCSGVSNRILYRTALWWHLSVSSGIMPFLVPRPTTDLLHKSHNAPVPYPTTYHFVQFITDLCTPVHISVTKCCIVRYLSNVLWDLWDWSVIWTMQDMQDFAFLQIFSSTLLISKPLFVVSPPICFKYRLVHSSETKRRPMCDCVL